MKTTPITTPWSRPLPRSAGPGPARSISPPTGCSCRRPNSGRLRHRRRRSLGPGRAWGRGASRCWSEGFGYADLERHAPITAETQFRIGSVSKPLTADAVVQLVDAHRLDLDAPVQRYLPSFPDKGAPITTRLLAGHLAGIRHYQGG